MIFLQGFWKKDREIKNESYILINKSVFSKSKKIITFEEEIQYEVNNFNVPSFSFFMW